MVYFTQSTGESEEESGRLFRIKLDGSGKEQLTNAHTISFNVVGNWIYYGNNNRYAKSWGLFRMSIDGKNKE